ncbi:hypothetical protein DRQ09_02545 [candidate division KSB1 bacterium]|nr:MAG: hypothetical protein DRQ09_02545 [candidate division KSB1 bacterium]
MYKVSFIIPVQNEEKYISGCLESIFNSTYRNIEVIVVDNGSTDNTKEMLLPYLDRITYIFRDSGGIASARNLGFEKSNGKLLAFVDADDITGKMRIELQVKKMLENEKLGMVFCGCTYINDNGSFLHGVGRFPEFDKAKFIGMMFEKNRILSISTTLIRRNVLEDVGVFDESLPFLEDYDLWLRIGRKYPVDYIDLPITRIRKHSDNYRKKWKNTKELEKQILLKHDLREIASSLAMVYDNEEDFRVSFGKILLKTGNRIEAVKNFVKALKLNPDNFEAHFLIGNYYFENKEIDRAVVSYKRCLRINPQHAECRNNLGVLLYYKGDIANSRMEFEKAKSIKSNFVDAEFNLSCIRKNSGIHKLRLHI